MTIKKRQKVGKYNALSGNTEREIISLEHAMISAAQPVPDVYLKCT